MVTASYIYSMLNLILQQPKAPDKSGASLFKQCNYCGLNTWSILCITPFTQCKSRLVKFDAVALAAPFTVAAATTETPGARLTNVACIVTPGCIAIAEFNSVFTAVAVAGRFTENALMPGGANVPDCELKIW